MKLMLFGIFLILLAQFYMSIPGYKTGPVFASIFLIAACIFVGVGLFKND